MNVSTYEVTEFRNSKTGPVLERRVNPKARDETEMRTLDILIDAFPAKSSVIQNGGKARLSIHTFSDREIILAGRIIQQEDEMASLDGTVRNQKVWIVGLCVLAAVLAARVLGFI